MSPAGDTLHAAGARLDRRIDLDSTSGAAILVQIKEMKYPSRLAVRPPVLACALLGLLVAGSLRAELRWENSLVALGASSGEKLVRTGFRFANAGSQPISIVSVQPSCGCVATALEKTRYGPGENGVIKVTFDLSMDGLSGLQDRTIAVATDDGFPPTVLHLRVTVARLAEAAPQTLSWKQGEAGGPKKVVVTPGSGSAISVTQPYRGSGDFSVVIAPEPGSGRILVTVTPKTTAGPRFAQIDLRAAANTPTAAAEDFVLYAEVD